MTIPQKRRWKVPFIIVLTLLGLYLIIPYIPDIIFDAIWNTSTLIVTVMGWKQ